MAIYYHWHNNAKIFLNIIYTVCVFLDSFKHKNLHFQLEILNLVVWRIYDILNGDIFPCLEYGDRNTVDRTLEYIYSNVLMFGVII